MNKKLRLSYTKISFYLDCPARYYYRYEEKRPYYPTTMTKYGSNIHRTLKDVSESVKSGISIDKEAQISLFENQWKDVSSDTAKNAELKELGLTQIKEFIDLNNESLQNNTIFLEKSFSYPLEDIILTGYIDRVDALGENKVEIMDYKTGNTRPIFDDDLQLNLYALVCRDYFDLTPAKLSLYFLKNNRKISVDCKNEYIDSTRDIVLKTAQNISAQLFTPDPIPLDECTMCCYSRFCKYSSVG